MFREREGREKEKARNTNVWLPLTRPPLGTWLAAQARALTGTRTSDLSVHRPVLNPLSHTSQGRIFKCKHLKQLYVRCFYTSAHSLPHYE